MDQLVEVVWHRFPKATSALNDDFFDYLRSLQVDNLGAFAGRLLLNKMGAKHAPDGFRDRALQMIQTHRVEDPREQPGECKFGGPSRHKHVFSYAEYRIYGPCLDKLQPFEGAILQENGARGAHVHDSPLIAIKLPINPRVDRTACSEFLFLAELCWMLRIEGASESRRQESLTGVLRIFSTGPSCVSCLASMWQFRLLYPQISLEVDYVKIMQSTSVTELRRFRSP